MTMNPTCGAPTPSGAEFVKSLVVDCIDALPTSKFIVF